MTNTIILSFLGAVLSLAGIGVIIFRNLERVRVSAKEVPEDYPKDSLTRRFFESVKIFIVRFWAGYVLPNFYQLAEKILLNLGQLARKIDARLARFSDYIKGKRMVVNSGNNSEYWGGMIEFKNRLNGNGEKKEQ